MRLVITLGSLVGAGARAGPATRARRVYEAAAGAHAHDPRRAERLRQPLAVPSTSIYSRSDGIVPWQHSVLAESAQGENVEVRSSHLGMAMHPEVLRIIADRLLQPEGGWRPFQAGGALHGMQAAGRR